MPLKILQRYVIGEVLRAFLMALLTMTAVFVLFMVMAEASRMGLTPQDILALVPFVIPGTLPYSVPVSLLFAVTVVYGRLASDNEITAVKTAGLSVFAVLWPSIHLGIALSGTLLFLSGEAIPRANRQVKMMFFKSAEDMFYKFLKLDRQIDRSDWPFLIKVRDVEGRTMFDATFKRRAKPTPDNPSPFDMVVSAKKAVVRFDIQQGVARVHLDGAEVQLFGNHRDVAMLKDQILEIPLPKNTPLSPLKMIQEQTNTELRALEDQYRKNLTEEPRKQALLAGLWVGSGRIAKVPGEYGGMDWSGIREYVANIRYWNSRRNAFETELHLRVAMACGSFFFVVLGAPVGIWFARRDFLSAFITCFLPIIMVYYPLTLMGVNLGKEGLVAPVVALWAGNTVLGLLAGFVALPPVSRH